MNVVELAKKIKDKIAKPENWTRGFLARNNEGAPVLPNNPNACSWCLHGAMLAVLQEADDILVPATWANSLPVFLGFRSNTGVVKFNDSSTHEQVMNRLEIAISRQHDIDPSKCED